MPTRAVRSEHDKHFDASGFRPWERPGRTSAGPAGAGEVRQRDTRETAEPDLVGISRVSKFA